LGKTVCISTLKMNSMSAERHSSNSPNKGASAKVQVVQKAWQTQHCMWGLTLQWYHASTNITPWNICDLLPFHVSYHNWLLALAFHISLFYLVYYNWLYYSPGFQANKAVIP